MSFNKNSLVAFVALVLGALLWSGNAFTDEETRETKTGAKFTRDRTNNLLGKAWRDPSGLIWGDLVTNDKNRGRYMTYREAASYCESIYSRLPDIDEITKLRDWLGGNFYSSQILSNLIGHSFWASIHPDYPKSAYIFMGSSGTIGTDGLSSHCAVRCVMRADRLF